MLTVASRPIRQSNCVNATLQSARTKPRTAGMFFTVTMHELIPRSSTSPPNHTDSVHHECEFAHPVQNAAAILHYHSPRPRPSVPHPSTPRLPPGASMARGSPHRRIWPTPLQHQRGRMVAESVRHNSAPLPPLRAFPPPNSPQVPRLAGRHGLPHEPGALPGSPEEGPVLCFGTHCTSLWWGAQTCTLL